MNSDNLSANENIIKETYTHKFCAIIATIIGAIFAIPLPLLILAIVATIIDHSLFYGILIMAIISIFALSIVVNPCVQIITQKVTITNRRIIVSSGWINKSILEIFPEKIESITVNQGLFGKAYDFGSVEIKGLGGTYDPMSFISNPVEIKELIQNMIRKATV